jgi:enoyl-CoA hydratase/carnithine racemase
MELGTVTYAAKDGIARVVLNRPDALNAISPGLLEDLDKVCAAVEGDPTVRAVTLTAAGRAFCAGADLKAVRELSPDAEKWARFMRLWHRVFNRIEALPVPVVAGVHGLALAGGLELTLVADLVVADEAARLGDQHANFGLVAGGGGSQRLPRLIGVARAKQMLLTGSPHDAATAERFGLVTAVACAVGGLAADLASTDPHPGFAFANCGLRLVLFILVAALISRIKVTRDREQQLAELEREAMARLQELNDMKDALMRSVIVGAREPLGDIYARIVTLGFDLPTLSVSETRVVLSEIADASRRLSTLVNNLVPDENEAFTSNRAAETPTSSMS